MRQVNILRQTEPKEEAEKVSQREVVPARKSGDKLAIARSLMSYAVTGLAQQKNIEQNLVILDEAGKLFSSDEGKEFKQGLGWYWIVQADLINANLIKGNITDTINNTTKALEILKPIENWIGVARAYKLRAKAYKLIGKVELSNDDIKQQEFYEQMSNVIM